MAKMIFRGPQKSLMVLHATQSSVIQKNADYKAAFDKGEITLLWTSDKEFVLETSVPALADQMRKDYGVGVGIVGRLNAARKKAQLRSIGVKVELIE